MRFHVASTVRSRKSMESGFAIHAGLQSSVTMNQIKANLGIPNGFSL